MNEGKRIDYVMLDPRKPVAQRDRRRLLKGFAALLFFSFLVGSVFRSIRSVSNSTEHSKLISLLTNQNWYCSAEDEGSKISTLEKYDSEKTFHGLALYVDTGSGSILLKAHYNGQYELSDRRLREVISSFTVDTFDPDLFDSVSLQQLVKSMLSQTVVSTIEELTDQTFRTTEEGETTTCNHPTPEVLARFSISN